MKMKVFLKTTSWLLLPTTQTQDQVKGRLLLDVVVGQGTSILQLFSSEDQPLLVWGDTFFVLNLGLHILKNSFQFEKKKRWYKVHCLLSKKYISGNVLINVFERVFKKNENESFFKDDKLAFTAHHADAGPSEGSTPSGCCSRTGYVHPPAVFQRRSTSAGLGGYLLCLESWPSHSQWCQTPQLRG